jgi:hypothetical protein
METDSSIGIIRKDGDINQLRHLLQFFRLQDEAAARYQLSIIN